MTPQESYRAFCAGRDELPLFMQPYWLDAVCVHAPWNAVLSYDDQGAVRGAWAFQTGTKWGMTWIRLPVITPFTGIWLDIAEGLTPQKQLALRHEILSDLITQLPKAHIFELKVQWPLQDWLPFYWRGYRQETHYTFRFPHIDVAAIEKNFSSNFQRKLQSADKYYRVEACGVAELYPMMERVFAARERDLPLSAETLQNIVDVLRERNQCHLYAARDGEGLQAALLAVWDAHTTYYLLGGRNRKDNKHGFQLLLWHAIRDAAQRGHAFDFEGSMLEGVNTFFQGFGAELTPYLYLYRYRGVAQVKYQS